MKKLALNLDDLAVQSFSTTAAASAPRGTVRGHLDDASHDELACSDACGSQVYSCATCDTCDEGCNDDGGDDVVLNRRIILY